MILPSNSQGLVTLKRRGLFRARTPRSGNMGATEEFCLPQSALFYCPKVEMDIFALDSISLSLFPAYIIWNANFCLNWEVQDVSDTWFTNVGKWHMSFAWSSHNGIRSLKFNTSHSVLVLEADSVLVCKMVFDTVWSIIEILNFLQWKIYQSLTASTYIHITMLCIDYRNDRQSKSKFNWVHNSLFSKKKKKSDVNMIKCSYLYFLGLWVFFFFRIYIKSK